jgi:hypothetical protein
MSVTEFQLIVKSELPIPSGRPVEVADWPLGWRRWSVRTPPLPHPGEAEREAIRVAETLRTSLLATYVETDDWGYVLGVTPGAPAARVLLDPEAALLHHRDSWIIAAAASAGREADYDALAAWSRHSPRRTTAQAVRAAVEEDRVVSQIVWTLEEEMGLWPPPRDLVWVWQGGPRLN